MFFVLMEMPLPASRAVSLMLDREFVPITEADRYLSRY